MSHSIVKISRVFIFVILALCIQLPGQEESEVPPAFPGAEGFGKYVQGGTRLPPDLTRPVQIQTFFVTNLNDRGAGSLREAVESSGFRVVIFKVSGVIELDEPLNITQGNITIAGQTAPGDGICIAGYPLGIQANNVVIRFLRMRLGDANNIEADAFGIATGHSNIIIDHCSASWAVDETFSLYGVSDVTIQWNLISESLYESVHDKGTHGYGAIWGGNGVTFHHNMFAHHTSRNPRFNGGRFSKPELVDFRNNVIYNWGFNSAYGGEDEGRQNVVNNYYKAGPATRDHVKNRIVEPSYDRDMSGEEILYDGERDHTGRWYVAGNYVHGFPEITANNWAGGVQGEYADKPEIRMDEPFDVVEVPTESAEEAYKNVLKWGGALLPRRDPIDRRIMEEARTGTATYGGSYNEEVNAENSGIIDTPSDVGGYPEYSSTDPLPDSDEDGIPDVWESENGLDPNDASDAHEIEDPSGYSNLELYLNALAAPAMPEPYHKSPELTFEHLENAVKISWDPVFAGFLLEKTGDPKPDNWEPVPGSQEGISITLSPSEADENTFFRLRR